MFEMNADNLLPAFAALGLVLAASTLSSVAVGPIAQAFGCHSMVAHEIAAKRPVIAMHGTPQCDIPQA
jgi:hypothetical protein